MDLLQLATQYIYKPIQDRYVTNEMVFEFLKTLNSNFLISELGQSVQGRSIKSVKFGTGNMKIFMWSQMHGNESTTTKGLIDFLNYLNLNEEKANDFKEKYTLLCIPILNPDGAAMYTRYNANEIDLNRDAKQQTQPESLILRDTYLNFKPDYCFNLHDQRTIFGTDSTGLPATMSFLSPAFNEERTYNNVRMKAVAVINSMNTKLQQYIPNQVGRFDDSFNDNCIGDYLTTLNIPTVLFEAGHFQNDYNREEVRKFVFISLFVGISSIYENVVVDNELDEYLKIPQNKSNFRDFIYKNIKIFDDNSEKLINFAAQYREVLNDSKIEFTAEISEVNGLEDFFGHTVIDGKGLDFDSEFGKKPIIGKKADFSLNKMLKFRNGLQLF